MLLNSNLVVVHGLGRIGLSPINFVVDVGDDVRGMKKGWTVEFWVEMFLTSIIVDWVVQREDYLVPKDWKVFQGSRWLGVQMGW